MSTKTNSEEQSTERDYNVVLAKKQPASCVCPVTCHGALYYDKCVHIPETDEAKYAELVESRRHLCICKHKTDSKLISGLWHATGRICAGVLFGGICESKIRFVYGYVVQKVNLSSM